MELTEKETSREEGKKKSIEGTSQDGENKNAKGGEVTSMETNEVDLGGLDLEGMEKACENLKELDFSPQQVNLLSEVIRKTKVPFPLEISEEDPKETENKRKLEGGKRGRKNSLEKLGYIGANLVAFGQYLMIKEVFLQAQNPPNHTT